DGEWADSAYDERHRFVMSALFDLPIGEAENGQVPGRWGRAFSNIEVAPIVTISSGRPADAITGADDSLTRAWPTTARPIGFSRNALRLPASAAVDLRVLKSVDIHPHGKLDLVVEAFNLLNRTNVTELNVVYGPLLDALPTFRRAIAAGSARQI